MNEEIKETFAGQQLPAVVWSDKYRLKDEEGNPVEDLPEDMHHRLALEFSGVSLNAGWDNSLEGLSDYGQERDILSYRKAYFLMHDFKSIIPQGSVMAMLGNPHQIGSLSNCIVLDDVVDSYGGIMYTDQQLAQLMKRRCGVGVDISKLRPRGTVTHNAAMTSTGAVSFARRFSRTTNEVAQEGRRGALMLTLDCRHPDLEEFIKSKGTNKDITGANISVKWNDDFIEAAKADEEYTLRWPIDASVEDAEVTKTVNARDIMELTAKYAHGFDTDKQKNSKEFGGDPGCMFIDRMISYSTDCGYPGITVLTTNPCGEIGMWVDSCRLIVLNFMATVKNAFQDDGYVDFDLIYKLAYEMQIMLDNLVSLEIERMTQIIDKVRNDPEDSKYKQIELQTWLDLRDSAIKYRRTGGGFTALADALAAVGAEYGSEFGNSITKQMMKAKLRGEWDASIDLAIQRGAFPEWDAEYDNTEFFDMLEEEFPEIYERNMKYGRRNISLSTVAPTGSVSLLANINGEYSTSSGIEPVFSTEPNVMWHTRNKRADQSDDWDYIDDEGNKWKRFNVFHKGFKQWLEANGYDYGEMGDSELKEAAAESPYVTSAGLDYKQRIDTQALVQRYVTHSISSTLNLPEDEDWKTTYEIYKYAHEAGLKGVTVFRNGCKDGVLDSGTSGISGIEYHDAPSRPEILEADVHVIQRGDTDWVITIGLLDGDPYEMFVGGYEKGDEVPSYLLENVDLDYSVRKNEKKQYILRGDGSQITNLLLASPSSDVDVLTRFTSMLMRHGAHIDYISEQVEKADINITDFSTIIGKVLGQYTSDPDSGCPNCSEDTLIRTEGCIQCQSCGYSKC